MDSDGKCLTSHKWNVTLKKIPDICSILLGSVISLERFTCLHQILFTCFQNWSSGSNNKKQQTVKKYIGSQMLIRESATNMLNKRAKPIIVIKHEF